MDSDVDTGGLASAVLAIFKTMPDKDKKILLERLRVCCGIEAGRAKECEHCRQRDGGKCLSA